MHMEPSSPRLGFLMSRNRAAEMRKAQGFRHIWNERAESLMPPPGVPLPWVGGRRNESGTLRTLYLQLVRMDAEGTLRLVRAEPHVGFWGITRVRVPAEGRAALDAAFVPSLAFTRDDPVMRKWVIRIWKQAGFVETQWPDGALEMAFNANVHALFACQRSRKKKLRLYKAEQQHHRLKALDDERQRRQGSAAGAEADAPR